MGWGGGGGGGRLRTPPGVGCRRKGLLTKHCSHFHDEEQIEWYVCMHALSISTANMSYLDMILFDTHLTLVTNTCTFGTD